MFENLLKKALLFNAEVLAIASEKVQEVASSYVEKGTLHDAEAKRFVSEVREKLEATEKEWEEKLSKLTKMLQDMGLNLKKNDEKNDENLDLDTEIKNLEKKLEELKMKKEVQDKK
jgi:polyhydroxyalkanoate synthesis regulator phasin